MLNGEYGLKDLCIGVPVVLGKNCIENIIELKLNSDEMKNLSESAEGVRMTNSLLDI